MREDFERRQKGCFEKYLITGHSSGSRRHEEEKATELTPNKQEQKNLVQSDVKVFITCGGSENQVPIMRSSKVLRLETFNMTLISDGCSASSEVLLFCFPLPIITDYSEYLNG